jgi:hypothetical protein
MLLGDSSMLQPYNIIKSNGESFQIQPGQVDTTSTDLALPGKGRVDYGQQYDTNLVRLLENFASPIKPGTPGSPFQNPTPGQLWYDTSNKVLMLFDPSKPTTWLELLAVGVTDRFQIPTVNALPTTNLISGDLTLLSTDSKLYLYDGTAWRALATEVWAETAMVVDGGASPW